MCGIGGFFARTPRPRSVAERMLASLRQRGPDAEHAVLWDAGFRAESGASVANALLHTRLSIIDPRPVADQPMSNERGDLWISYNGEIYGWQEDAAALQRSGVVFRTRSDTEFILRAYEVWGIGCLERLRGMFAFAILDLRRGELHLARDRMGLKPLVYYHGDGEIGFGSLVRTVLPFLPPGKRELSPDGIDAYLAHRYVPAPMTAFAHVRRLENAHRIRYDLAKGTLEKHRYWLPVADAGSEWRERLDEAVALRTVADRPLGVFLSGGLDSALVACRLAATGHGGLGAFIATFPGSAFDEGEQAHRTAARFGLAPHPVPWRASLGDDFSRLVTDLDEPFADPSAFPAWYLARETARHVKVVLGGDGGDELFAGYKRYRAHLRSARRRGLRLPLPVLPDSKPKGWRKQVAELSFAWEDAYALRFSGFTPNQRRFLQPALGDVPPHRWRSPETAANGALDVLLEIDRLNYLPEYILRKADLCTMAHGLELRAPLLDHRLFEAVRAMRAEDRFTAPAKRAFASACPALDELGLFAAKKHGFNPPLDRWLGENLGERFDGLGFRLADATGGQLAAPAVDRLASAYLDGMPSLAEQMLQLLVLDESLRQLAELTGEPVRAALHPGFPNPRSSLAAGP